MKKTDIYSSPEIYVQDVCAEAGFADSDGDGGYAGLFDENMWD